MNDETIKTVYREELLYYKQAWGRMRRLSGVLLVALSALLVFPALRQLAWISTAPGFDDQSFGTLLAAQVGVWVIQLLVIGRGVSLGVDLIHHLHNSPTYALLLVSQANNWRIFVGKWRAGMRLMLPFIVALALIRLLILPITATAAVIPFVSDNARYAGCAFFTPQDCPGVQIEGVGWFLENTDPGWDEIYFVLAPITAIVLSFLEAASAVMLGMAAGVWFKRRMAISLALLIRLAVPLAVLLLIASRDFGWTNATMRMQNPSTSFALVDAGTAATIRMVIYPRLLWERLTQNWLDVGLAVAYLAGLLLAAGMMTYAAFRRNRVLVRGQSWHRAGT